MGTDGKAAKELIDELSEWDKIVNAEMNKFRKAVEGIRECYANEYFAEIFKKNLNSIPKTAKAANEVIETIQAARLAKSVADFIQADVHAMQGIATGMAAPGQLFGKTLFVAGS